MTIVECLIGLVTESHEVRTAFFQSCLSEGILDKPRCFKLLNPLLDHRILAKDF